MQMTLQQAKALKAIAGGVIEAVKAGGQLGAPGGVMYAAMMGQGCTLQQFEGIMGGLVKAGFLTKKGECYHVTGKEFPA